MQLVWRSVLAALGMLAPVPAARQAPAALAVGAVRFYRADVGQTRINAFIQIPYALMTPTTEGGDGRISYRVTVKVTDSTGLVLYQQPWTNHAPASDVAANASAMEMVHFSVPAGRYQLAVAVEDSVSGRRAEALLAVEGFPTRPEASDLLLSPGIRVASADDTVPRAGELRWGSALVLGAARLELTALRPRAFYLLEVYGAADSGGTMSLGVQDTAGTTLVRTAPTRVRMPENGGLLKGQLDLTGLPPGSYRMVATLSLNGREIVRSAPFEMESLERVLAQEAARRDALRLTDAGYFAEMTGAELDEAEAPLTFLADASELKVYSPDLSVQAKRKFLTDFWGRHDPTPATAKNEAREQFYAGVEYANRAYKGAGRSQVAGWRTDRGRIYIKNGAPDEVFRRQQEGRAPPYEVWRYTSRGKDRYYCFADRTSLGAYVLIYSNDLKETSRPNWRVILTEPAVADVGRFLNIDFYSNTR